MFGLPENYVDVQEVTDENNSSHELRSHTCVHSQAGIRIINIHTPNLIYYPETEITILKPTPTPST